MNHSLLTGLDVAVLLFFNDTATTEIYTYGHTLSLHDALPISSRTDRARRRAGRSTRRRPARRAAAARSSARGGERFRPLPRAQGFFFGVAALAAGAGGFELAAATCAAPPSRAIVLTAYSSRTSSTPFFSRSTADAVKRPETRRG